MVGQPFLTAIVLVFLAIACSAKPIPDGQTTRVGPSIDVAAQRGPQIFNAVFDSLRKYDSAVHPNGMSFLVATVPEGVLLHHGNGRNATPTTLDWLAYEIEHAEIFASADHRRRRHRKGPGSMTLLSEAGAQAVLQGESTSSYEEEHGHGWLHTYQTTRPLRFLYIDGMSGNKDDTGVIDSQDYILRALSSSDSVPGSPPGPPGEPQRALDLCKLCAEWQLQGVIRTEDPGTEIIKCDFSDGLKELQSVQRVESTAKANGDGHGPGRRPGERPGSKFAYDFETCFHDVGSARTLLDFSTMVSAFFFPVNLTNPNQDESDLPRLVWTSDEDRTAIKSYLARIITEQRSSSFHSGASWRDVADLIVRRYAKKLILMTNATAITTLEDFAENVESLLSVFTDYAVDDPETRDSGARQRCANFYLQTKPQTSESDRLIYAAFKATNENICNVLFDVRKVVLDNSATSNTLESAQASVRQLMNYLDWTVFEKK